MGPGTAKGSFLFAGALKGQDGLKLRICGSGNLERDLESSAQYHSVDPAAPSRDREQKYPLLELLKG